MMLVEFPVAVLVQPAMAKTPMKHGALVVLVAVVLIVDDFRQHPQPYCVADGLSVEKKLPKPTSSSTFPSSWASRCYLVVAAEQTQNDP